MESRIKKMDVEKHPSFYFGVVADYFFAAL